MPGEVGVGELVALHSHCSTQALGGLRLRVVGKGRVVMLLLGELSGEGRPTAVNSLE